MNPFIWVQKYVEFLDIKRARAKFTENEHNDATYGSFQVVDMVDFADGNKKPVVTDTIRITTNPTPKNNKY